MNTGNLKFAFRVLDFRISRSWPLSPVGEATLLRHMIARVSCFTDLGKPKQRNKHPTSLLRFGQCTIFGDWASANPLLWCSMRAISCRRSISGSTLGYWCNCKFTQGPYKDYSPLKKRLYGFHVSCRNVGFRV